MEVALPGSDGFLFMNGEEEKYSQNPLTSKDQGCWIQGTIFLKWSVKLLSVLSKHKVPNYYTAPTLGSLISNSYYSFSIRWGKSRFDVLWYRTSSAVETNQRLTLSQGSPGCPAWLGTWLCTKPFWAAFQHLHSPGISWCFVGVLGCAWGSCGGVTDEPDSLLSPGDWALARLWVQALSKSHS